MPIRANIGDVRDVLADQEANVLTQLIMASQMVDVLLGSSSLGTVTLKQIEIYLACHIYTQSSPDVVRESYDGASFQYAGPSSYGEGLCSTKWGQMAQLLDTTGKLRNLDKKHVSLHVI
jgi:hypothetical protein